MTLREGDAAERRALQLHLLERSIDSRLMLGGNMTSRATWTWTCASSAS